MFYKSLSLLPLVFGTLAQAYSNPGSCSGTCWTHDPSVIQRTSDNAYFRFSTGSGIEVTKATSLSGPWTSLGYALPKGSEISVSGNSGSDLWAPDVHKIGDQYYMYYAISSFGSQVSSIGLATSKTMEAGSWTDQGAIGVSSSAGKSYNAIDPNLIQVGSTYLMNFGSFWGDIFQVPLSRPSAHGSAASYNIAATTVGTHALEGSYMFYYSGTGYYYLLISNGICCGYDATRPAAGAEYKIIMCRSKSATGSFVDKNGKACTAGGGSVLLESHGKVYGPGGQGVFTDSSNGLVLYYHYVDTSVGYADSQKRFGWNKLSWSSGWPVV
ncbi:arabinan endo-1,5-alpha-L-arabinosidase-2 [Coleophoma cylindrospora]|uniref:Arabinan endo-1,5-alpha-L-arabinosidase n=1 Tax=Coleophoma cylindrospora TaxID=1849047 RepID=A0A3D8SDL6_9HELO|nr:arabinan endo-1,5-alpha-L-arabinosidase-2 [Coleophoma cylindrospora]